MKALTRTRSGRFDISESLTLSDLEKLVEENRLEEVIVPVTGVFTEYREIRAEEEVLDKLLRNGNPFRYGGVPDVKAAEPFCVYDSEGMFIGIYEFAEDKQMYYPRKIFLGGN